MDNIWQKAGGTKFLITLIVIVASIVLVWFGKIDGTQFVAAITAIGGLYFAGNVGATFANAKVEAAKK